MCVQPSVSLCISCGTLIIDFLQFIQEYTGKVDDLIKDKIEATNKERAKDEEAKDVAKEQVYAHYALISLVRC